MQNAFQTRKIMIASSAALIAVMAATAWVLISFEGSSAAKPAAAAAQAPGTSPAATAAQSPLGDPAADSARTPAAERKPAKKPAKAARRAVHPPKKAATRVLSSGTCQASFYDEPQATASGERFNPGALTAAHKTLPLGSRVRVTNRSNGDSVVVRINDRGPYVGGRCLDLSRAAMAAVGGLGSGVVPVRYEVLARR